MTGSILLLILVVAAALFLFGFRKHGKRLIIYCIALAVLVSFLRPAMPHLLASLGQFGGIFIVLGILLFIGAVLRRDKKHNRPNSASSLPQASRKQRIDIPSIKSTFNDEDK